ncbi:hypothetical protein RHMOL_Rhmol06G0100600 [Rhododendron molle]|uniref:Uncharacterized protein n=1 Tax=Rhododendron molle TaxID=49168 RepID=A0ACC0NAR8_RHOML|nr:hypothetical protein RHMOL_Rhmol06G0100600 [Rhododendron molle]
MEVKITAESLLDKIRSSHPEDGGLKDCALPPDWIKEAFLKAATAVSSRAASIFEKEEEHCVEDPYDRVGGQRGCGSSAWGLRG